MESVKHLVRPREYPEEFCAIEGWYLISDRSWPEAVVILAARLRMIIRGEMNGPL